MYWGAVREIIQPLFAMGMKTPNSKRLVIFLSQLAWSSFPNLRSFTSLSREAKKLSWAGEAAVQCPASTRLRGPLAISFSSTGRSPPRIPQAGNGEPGDVLNQTIDKIRRNDIIGIKPRQYQPRVWIQQALSGHAVATHPELLVTYIVADEFSYGFGQLLRVVGNIALHDLLKKTGGLAQFPADELAVPRQLLVEEPHQVGSYQRAQTKFGACALRFRIEWVGLRHAPARVPDHFSIERLFVAKMVVNRGDIGTSSFADFAHSSGAEAVLGENFARGLKQALAGIVGGLLLHYQKSWFRQLFRTYR